MPTRDIDFIIRVRDETAAGINSAQARVFSAAEQLRAHKGGIFGPMAAERPAWAASIKEQYEARAGLEDQLFRATHSRQQVELAETDAHFAAIQTRWSGHQEMLTLIDQTAAAERANIHDQMLSKISRSFEETGRGTGGLTKDVGLLQSEFLRLGVSTAIVSRAATGGMNLISGALKATKGDAEALVQAIEGLPFGIGKATAAAADLLDVLTGTWQHMRDFQSTAVNAEGLRGALGGLVGIKLEMQKILELQGAGTEITKEEIALRQKYEAIQRQINDLAWAHPELTGEVKERYTQLALQGYEAELQELDRARFEKGFIEEGRTYKAKSEEKIRQREKEIKQDEEDRDRFEREFIEEGRKTKVLADERKQQAHETIQLEIRMRLEGFKQERALMEARHRAEIDDSRQTGQDLIPLLQKQDAEKYESATRHARDLRDRNKALTEEAAEAEIRAYLKGDKQKIALLLLRQKIEREGAEKLGLNMDTLAHKQKAEMAIALRKEPTFAPLVERGFLTQARIYDQPREDATTQIAQNTATGAKASEDSAKLLTDVIAALQQILASVNKNTTPAIANFL
jgi:hypothetical protein